MLFKKRGGGRLNHVEHTVLKLTGSRCLCFLNAGWDKAVGHWVGPLHDFKTPLWLA